MGPADPELCAKCTIFDVRALLLAAEAQPPRNRDRNEKEGLPQFFCHLPDLPSLKTSAAKCDFCRVIWDEYAAKVDACELTDDALRLGLGMEAVWIGTTPYIGGLHGLPHVMISQRSDTGHSRILAYFEVCVQRGCEPSNDSHLLASSIFEDSGSFEALALCREWLRHCCENHEACSSMNHLGVELPTRVIEVDATDVDGKSRPRLVDGERRRETFAALSYCWGGESLLTLTTNSETELRLGLYPDRFPATIRDAIVVTQHLQIKYLWVDSIAIKQDDPEDWAREATKMRDVYKGAVVTIAAAASSKSSDGIFRKRRPQSSYCRLFWKNSAQPYPTVFLRPGSEIWDDPARSSSMHTRGWTLQESLLAPRTIYLGAQLLVFECPQGQIDEAGRSLNSTENYRSKALMQTMYRNVGKGRTRKILRSLGVPHVLKLYYPSISRMKDQSGDAMRGYHRYGLRSLWRLLNSAEFYTQGYLQTPGGSSFTYYDLWREIVMQYSARQLTKSTDTLPALAGLADEFHQVTNDDYIAGMWLGDIMRSLCWTLLLKKVPGKDCGIVYLAPSWSWAALHGYQVRFFGGDATQSTEFWTIAKIVDIKATPAGWDPFSRVIGGHLTITAPFLQIPDPQERPPPDLAVPGLFERAQLDVVKEDEFRLKHAPHQGQEFALLKLAAYKTWHTEVTGMGLLVESTGDGRWRRIGLVSVRMMKESTDFLGRDETEIMRAREWKRAAWIKRTVCII